MFSISLSSCRKSFFILISFFNYQLYFYFKATCSNDKILAIESLKFDFLWRSGDFRSDFFSNSKIFKAKIDLFEC